MWACGRPDGGIRRSEEQQAGDANRRSKMGHSAVMAQESLGVGEDGCEGVEGKVVQDFEASFKMRHHCAGIFIRLTDEDGEPAISKAEEEFGDDLFPSVCGPILSRAATPRVDGKKGLRQITQNFSSGIMVVLTQKDPGCRVIQKEGQGGERRGELICGMGFRPEEGWYRQEVFYSNFLKGSPEETVRVMEKTDNLSASQEEIP